MYIHLSKKWPNFSWDSEELMPLLAKVRNTQGELAGKMESLGFDLKNEALLESLSEEVVRSCEIEGEILDREQVRSSVARRLGMEISGLVESDRNVDGVVEMLLDATQNFDNDLTEDRLFGWHSALFPSGRSGMHKIVVGNWRDDSSGPMQVVSGAMGKEKIHFEAPISKRLPKEMKTFITWFNNEHRLDKLFKSGIAHLWFVTIHPFDDGNGRIARAITDMMLSKSEKYKQRYYSMSSQIRKDRKKYYQVLERTQKGVLEITEWMNWFLNCLLEAIELSDLILKKVLFKHEFWKINKSKNLNARQVKMMNLILDNFKGKLTSSKWAKINKCSQDTALRDIQGLMDHQVLIKEMPGGRSTNYELKNKYNKDSR